MELVDLLAGQPFLAMETTYFNFEQDFVEDNIRCIPMIVRFKLDAAGIKLKLAEWSRMNHAEREMLAILPVDTDEHIAAYKKYLKHLIVRKTGNEPTEIAENTNYDWAVTNRIPETLNEKLQGLNWSISVEKWSRLTDLQRFSLIKLSQSAHEHKNLPKALKEFDLV